MIINSFLTLLRSTQQELLITFMGVYLIVTISFLFSIDCTDIHCKTCFRNTSDLDIAGQNPAYIQQIYKPPPPYPISNSTPDLARAYPLGFVQNPVSHYFIDVVSIFSVLTIACI